MSYTNVHVSDISSDKGSFRWYHTPTSLGQLCEFQQGVVARDWLEGDIGMPLLLPTLPTLATTESIGKQPLRLLGGDDTDLVILPTVVSPCVIDRVDVQLRRLRFA